MYVPKFIQLDTWTNKSGYARRQVKCERASGEHGTRSTTTDGFGTIASIRTVATGVLANEP